MCSRRGRNRGSTLTSGNGGAGLFRFVSTTPEFNSTCIPRRNCPVITDCTACSWSEVVRRVPVATLQGDVFCSVGHCVLRLRAGSGRR